MPRCLVVQHAEPEEPYAIGDALTGAGVELDVCRVFAGEEPPVDLAEIDALVVMGGPMSAAGDDRFPTRQAELGLLADALARGRPALGVCLGAQLLAAAGGGRVYRGDAGPEIGWGPVTLGPAAATDALLRDLPVTTEALHWHGDTFDLPDGAVHLASSDRYPNQAFRLGASAWGLQFHVEVDARALDAYLEAFAAHARKHGVDPAQIEARAGECLAALGPWRLGVSGRFAALVAETARR